MDPTGQLNLDIGWGQPGTVSSLDNAIVFEKARGGIVRKVTVERNRNIAAGRIKSPPSGSRP